MRVVKENSTSQNNSTTGAAGADRNIPQDNKQASSSEGKQSNDENKKNEELTNFELSSKTITTVSGGYTVENISIAVLVNRASFSAGPARMRPSPTPSTGRSRRSSYWSPRPPACARSAATRSRSSAVEFMPNENDMGPVEAPGWADALTHQLGSVINALALIAVTVMLVVFGLRPATRALLAEAPAAAIADSGASMLDIDNAVELPFTPLEAPEFTMAAAMDTGLIEDIANQEKFTQQKRLEQLIEADEMQAVAILKQWMYAEGRV